MSSPVAQPQSGEPVEVVQYDPQWQVSYEKERDLLFSAIGELNLDIQHIGSTAVPGLGAKPVIDIMVGVRTLDEPKQANTRIEAIGYQFLGENNIPGRLFFRKGTPSTHQIHMTVIDSEFWNRHILFRDYLRAHPSEAKVYEELKYELAAKLRNDRLAYNDAKTEYIQNALVMAQAWRDAGH